MEQTSDIAVYVTQNQVLGLRIHRNSELSSRESRQCWTVIENNARQTSLFLSNEFVIS